MHKIFQEYKEIFWSNLNKIFRLSKFTKQLRKFIEKLKTFQEILRKFLMQI